MYFQLFKFNNVGAAAQASQGGQPILGFYWSKAAVCDFVLVTPGAVELYQRAPHGLRLLEHRRHESSEPPLYSHATRVLLLRCGSWFQVRARRLYTLALIVWCTRGP